MKFFSPLLLLGTVTVAEPQFEVKGPSLEDVFGPVAVVEEMTPWSQRGRRTRQSAARSASYYSTRTTDNCVFPIELYLVADETGSFQDDYENMLNSQIMQMYDGLTSTHPETTFGIGSFKDIPISTLGNEGDYCWKFRQSITAEISLIKEAYADLISSGGGDVPEAQFKGIMAACQGSEVGWSNPDATRVVVVVTDAQPHFSNDTFNKPEYHLSPYSGTFDEANQDEQCRTQYYPSPEQVKAAIFGREVYTGFLVYDGHYDQGGEPIEAWKWFNSYIEQFDGFVGDLAIDSSNFWMRLSDIITEIENLECVDPTTTTTTTLTTTTTTATIEETTTTTTATTTPTTATTITETTTPTTETTRVITLPPPLTRPVPEDTTAPECGECIGSCDPGCNAVDIKIRDKPSHVRLQVDDEVWERGEKKEQITN